MKEAEITRTAPSTKPTRGSVRRGFVYERVPHITLKSIANNAEIDASIAARADSEYLYDKPYAYNKRVRVAGPFTVESLSPHRVLGMDDNDELIDATGDGEPGYSEATGFVEMILDHLRTAGVQQAHKADKISFTALTPWPGDLICAEGRYVEGGSEEDEGAAGPAKRAAIFMGPEFGTVSRPDLDEVIPLQERIESVADDADLQEVYDTERHLLYVACTRARDNLLVTSVDPASEFLDDLRG